MKKEIISKDFSEVLSLVKSYKQKAYKEVNRVLIELYWNIGEYISTKTQKDNWGKSIVEELAVYISRQEPNIKGFTARNLWRMKQFYETYRDNKKLSPLVSEISWTNNLIILSSAKSDEEREFYIYITIKERYSKRELQRQIKSGLYVEFYLEALDRDIKKPHENPSIGVLLCRQKDDEVVKYALSRSVSSTVISQYETKLIPKDILKQKLNEFYTLLESNNG